jgi:glutamine amidotransferase
MEKINERGLCEVIHKTVSDKKPFLGICLGLQLMFDESEESPGVKGLGVLQGKIVKIPEKEGGRK